MYIDFGELREHLLQWARRWTRQEADAQDVAQRVLVRALTSGTLPNGSASLRTWAYTAARNDCLAFYSPNEQRRPHVEDLPPDTHILIDRRTPEAAVVAQQALGAASEKTEVLMMALGYDYDTIAECQGIPVGTVRSRGHRQREALREEWR